MLEDLEDVILFAAQAHKNQKMIEPEVTYLAHLIGVASNVLEAYHNGEEKFDLNYALKVAILHDVIEDTNVCYENIEKRYGKRIADGVLALTKNEEISKEKRIQEALTRIKKCEKEVAIVKLADRTFNMRTTPLIWDNNQCQMYANDAQKIIDELGSCNAYLKNKLEERIKRYRLNE